MRPRLRLLALLMATPLVGGCLEVCYLGQAAAGQDDLFARARPLDEAIADPRVAPEVRRQLGLVARVKRFGERHGLAPTKSYEEYADLEREAAVWVVSAAEPLRLVPTTWRFPIVGEVPYLGWFDKADAQDLGRELEARGLDVSVREARAYSTLGWFRDPVLSTMLRDGAADLVDVVLHESTHATHYVASQTVFNESLASFVARRLTARFLAEELRLSPLELHDHAEREHTRDRRVRRFRETLATLEALYATDRPPAEKLSEKRRILEALRRELALGLELNHAVLLQARAYGSGEAGFATLLDACGGDFRRFLSTVRRIDGRAFARRDEPALDDLLAARARVGCEPAPTGPVLRPAAALP
ncbi:MAG: aminopeptidase [Deltaproteobacteria bacterium]|nr:aminopeptidase [Deltaproteobacteria bacterium]